MGVEQTRFDLMRLATDSLDQAVVATDMDGSVAFANEAFTRLTGYRADEVLGRRLSDVVPDFGDARNKLRDALRALQAVGTFKDDILFSDRSGEPKWATLTANVVSEDGEASRYIVASISDITFAKIYETLQHRLLRDLVHGKSLPAMMNMVCREVQQMLENIHMSVALIDQAGCLRMQAAPDLPAWYCDAIEGLATGPVVGSCGTAAWIGEAVNVDDIHTDPLWAPFPEITANLDYTSVWSIPIKAGDGSVKGVFAFYAHSPIVPSAFHWRIVDICKELCALALERTEAHNRVRHLANHDSLTGLFNRQYFHHELDAEIAHAAATDSPFAVHLIDLDGFKEINDRYGHKAGDDLLVAFARQLEGLAEGTDTIARLGGDEFAMLQTHCLSSAAAQRRAEQITRSIQELLSQGRADWETAGASVGFALCPKDAQTPEDLLRNADLALYRAKQSGRGKACSYTISMTHEVEKRRRLERDLRCALSRGGLGLHLVYQPQYRLSGNDLVGFEALVRWNHPEFGEILPEHFVPIAERAHLIGDLGAWVLREACLAASGWPQDVCVAVNLSPAQITEGDLPRLVHSTLLELGLSPSRLELEITENVLIEDKSIALHVLRRLSAMGVKIAMDDFGTGYASLSYLHFFPFDKIKIDQSFVSNLEDNAYSLAIVDAVLGLCSSIGIPVTAEGIETRAQLEILMGKNCDYGQGFYLGAPGDAHMWMPPGKPAATQRPLSA